VSFVDQSDGVDLSPLHRELDGLKRRLCRCNFQGECIACRGFEVLRQQSQMVVAAASQPVLMQVAQEASIKDLMERLGGAGEKIAEDSRVQELIAQLIDRVQEDLGGPEAMQRMFGSMGFPGMGAGGGNPWGFTSPDDRVPPDDRGPADDRPARPPADPPGSG
jgi:hypothetical protein